MSQSHGGRSVAIEDREETPVNVHLSLLEAGLKSKDGSL